MAKNQKQARATVDVKTSETQPETKHVEVPGDPEVLRGRFANLIQVSMQEEEVILDFFARVAERGSHVARVFITPQHAERLADLLKRQIPIHKDRFKNSAFAGKARQRSK